MRPELTTIDSHDGPDGTFYAAATAVIVGDVTIGSEANIWHHCSIRGDVAPIHIGRGVNVQDGSVLHCEYDVPLVIEEDVAIGHLAVVHCSQVASGTLIGIRAVVLDGCKIGRDCLIAAGSVLVPGTEVPAGSVVMGTPGRVVRPIREQERTYISKVVSGYVSLARQCIAGRFPAIPTSSWVGNAESQPGVL